VKMKPGLSPAVTTDKNGKVTTVYRKPLSGTESFSVIPAPTVTTEASTGHTAMATKLAATVHELLIFDEDGQEDKLRGILAQYPEELINKLDDHFAREANGSYLLAIVINEGVGASAVNELLAFAPYFKTDDTNIATSMLRSLHQYGQLPSMPDYSLASEEVRNQCIALITVTEALDEYQYIHGDGHLPIAYLLGNMENGNDLMMLQGDDLIALVLEQPADASTIADIIIERKTGDAELIREIMNQYDSKALNSGIL